VPEAPIGWIERTQRDGRASFGEWCTVAYLQVGSAWNWRDAALRS